MLAAQQAVFIDGVELKLIEARDAARPGFDDGLREPEIREAGNVRRRHGMCHFGKGGAINLSRSKYRPREFPVEGSTHRGGLFAADLPRSIGDAPHDIVKEAEDADAVSLPDLLRPPQPFEQVEGQEAVPDAGLSQARSVGPEAVRMTRPWPLIWLSFPSTD